MWLLQRKNIHKKHLLWLKIIGLCLGLHLIILLWVFCIYRENKYMYAFSINKKMDYSIPIIYSSSFALPQLHSSPPAVAKASDFAKASDSARATSDRSSDRPADKPLKEQPKPKAIITPKITTPQPTTTTKAVKTEPIKKQTEKATTITESLKKIVEPVQKVVPVETAKPVTPEKPAIPEKKEPAPKIEPKKEEAVAPVQQKLENKEELPATKTAPNAHVSNNFREVEALRRGAQLQKELVQKWQPPIGVSPDCTCDISFFVNKEGIIQNLKMVKSSGVMMFDVSARQALYAMKMPQWTHGKPLIINFKQ